jgi:general stress protein YciG
MATKAVVKKGGMTVAEAGRKGGEKVRDERGHEFYEEIGRKGGQRVRQLIEAGKRAQAKGR